MSTSSHASPRLLGTRRAHAQVFRFNKQEKRLGNRNGKVIEVENEKVAPGNEFFLGTEPGSGGFCGAAKLEQTSPLQLSLLFEQVRRILLSRSTRPQQPWVHSSRLWILLSKVQKSRKSQRSPKSKLPKAAQETNLMPPLPQADASELFGLSHSHQTQASCSGHSSCAVYECGCLGSQMNWLWITRQTSLLRDLISGIVMVVNMGGMIVSSDDMQNFAWAQMNETGIAYKVAPLEMAFMLII